MPTYIKHTYIYVHIKFYTYSGVDMDGHKHLLYPVIKIRQIASYAFILNKNQLLQDHSYLGPHIYK